MPQLAKKPRHPAPPRHLRDYRGLHAGETIVVCGCGRSLAELPEPERRITVGVNDVGRLFDPTYLVVLNPKRQFKSDRYRHVEATRARAVFTQLDLRLRHPRVVRFRLGQRSGTDLSDPDRLPYTRNSPYVALCLAAFLGAKRIGLIGVDFTDHHFFGRTGRHPLSRDLATIDREYMRLAEALAARGVEVVNLSRESRLTAFSKEAPATWLDGDPGPDRIAPSAADPSPRATMKPSPAARRLFLVHYPFLSCGDVFTRGLERAAAELGLASATASCKDPGLPAKIERFAPDLLFVIHGRTFRQRHPDGLRGRFPSLHRAVWLLDEPYEVDDTEVTSRLFDTVFINDPATLGRHGNAHYLPVAWDPGVHRPGSVERDLDVGFIGGGNPSRERMLDRLARAGLLSYVVGGPWRSPRLRRLCRSSNIPPAETTVLYQRTKLVINVFRDRHHFNRRGVEATSLNPRVYEALACGALVISEHRPELDEAFPELPTFRSEEKLEMQVRELLTDDETRRELLEAGRRRLDAHTYAKRLERVMEVTMGAEGSKNALSGRESSRDEPSQHVATKGKTRRPEISREEAEDPELTVLVGVCAGEGEPERRRNVRAILEALGAQDLERSRYRILVVEQDTEPGLEELLGPLADRWIFAYNPGPFNRGWGFNVGACRTGSRVLCLLDADLLPPPDFLRRALEMISGTTRAALPYRELIFLDEGSSRRLLEVGYGVALRELGTPRRSRWRGQRFHNGQGTCLWIEGELYRRIGGHDERFRGWGWEDRELWDRLSRSTVIRKVPQTLFHLHHPPAPSDDRWARANHRLYESLRRTRELQAPGPMGDPERYREEPVGTAVAPEEIEAPAEHAPEHCASEHNASEQKAPEHNGHGSLKISIVLPTFRRPELLPRTLDSLRAQSYGHWEAIVVDNAGDVDPSDAAFVDPRIRLVHHAEQTSASYARNRGLDYVTGDLVCFFDDDDEMLPGYLETFARTFLDHPRAKMVRCGLILADGRTVYCHATPQCCLRREFATPSWGRDRLHDQIYFRRIVRRNHWSPARGDVVEVRRALVRAGHADHGGLRAGEL